MILQRNKKTKINSTKHFTEITKLSYPQGESIEDDLERTSLVSRMEKSCRRMSKIDSEK
jgi:hypothetical protein